MTWWQRQAIGKVARVVASGTAVTVGGATVSCVLALCVERTAHRTLYRFFPHWYKDVDYAFGLEQYQLEAVKSRERETTTTTPAQDLDNSVEKGWLWQDDEIDNGTIFTNELQVKVAPLLVPVESEREQRLRYAQSANQVFDWAMTS